MCFVYGQDTVFSVPPSPSLCTKGTGEMLEQPEICRVNARLSTGPELD